MSKLHERIVPGARLGVFGGGQLGRMFTHAAQRMGYHVVVFTDEADCPASQVADATVCGDYLDPHAVKEFAQQVDVVTLEFENIHLEAVQRAAEWTLVRPSVEILAVAQHRIREKRTLRDLGFPVTPFHEVRGYQELPGVAEQLGWPLVLKTAKWGYDGKGQRKAHSLIEANDALELLGPEPVIAEKWITYQAEVSVIVARNPSGEIATYPMFTNTHIRHILDLTTCPASDDLRHVAESAQAIARGVAESLKLEGILCVEFFVSADGALMINELAPRPHNSGHLTIEAARTSQFEQQVRAVCNLPLGETTLIQPAAMVNLLGDIWGDNAPRFDLALERPMTYLHLYGKREARRGRKMGHITVLDQSPRLAGERALEARELLADRENHLF
ncbi:MAG: 5-(carboxyamino)imidazole ribonucleotide synthase [Planctomycetota bacterium]|jgi:5-(carboxyamino)imidazole ribonucleotide synthase